MTGWIVGTLVAFGAVALWALRAFNALVRRRNLVREAWSGIEVQLKRRHDLIPRLTEAVRGYIEHERGLLGELARTRAHCVEAIGPVGAVDPENALSHVLGRLFAVVEIYPELKASGNVLELQAGLVDVEDNLQLARRYYNGTVRDYNTAVQSFPRSLVARAFAFHAEAFFELDSALERRSPGVELQPHGAE